MAEEITGGKTLKDVNDTLSKAMVWAEEEEEYELCQRIKNLEDFLSKENKF